MIGNAILCSLSKTGLSEWGRGGYGGHGGPDFGSAVMQFFNWGGGAYYAPEFTNLPMTDLGNG